MSRYGQLAAVNDFLNRLIENARGLLTRSGVSTAAVVSPSVARPTLSDQSRPREFPRPRCDAGLDILIECLFFSGVDGRSTYRFTPEDIALLQAKWMIGAGQPEEANGKEAVGPRSIAFEGYRFDCRELLEETCDLTEPGGPFKWSWPVELAVNGRIVLRMARTCTLAASGWAGGVGFDNPPIYYEHGPWENALRKLPVWPPVPHERLRSVKNCGEAE